MKKRIFALVLIAALVATVFALTGCSGDQPDSTGYTKAQTDQSTFLAEAKKTEDQQQKFDKNDPPHTNYDHSLERKMLNDRMDRLNVPNKMGYFYAISFGKVMAYYTITGKVMSVNSLLTDPQQIISKQGYLPGAWGTGNEREWTNVEQFVVDSPDVNGTYGPNGPEGTVFFFTTDGALCDWHGDYLYTDKPLQLTTPPELVRNIK